MAEDAGDADEFRIVVHEDNGPFFAEVREQDSGLRFKTDPQDSYDSALTASQRWIDWCVGAPDGQVESIYYILAVPETWPGPPPGAHPYSGLHLKIGRAKDVLRRAQNLRTGTSDKMIVHAMEPGSAELERIRHEQFSSDRRQGEWFACSPSLTQHVWDIWRKHRLLPPQEAFEVARLLERTEILREVRRIMGGAPDMVNPSLNEKWAGRVLVDLVYGNPIEPMPKITKYSDFSFE